MSEHALTSASTIDRRARCLGSERLEAQAPPEDKDSEESKEGTLLHKHRADPSLDRSKLTHNQRDLLEVMARLHKEVYRRVEEQFGELPLGESVSEVTMFLHRGIKSLFPGTADIKDYFPELKLLLIIDDKTGFRPVSPAASNLQLRAYAAMGSEIHSCDHAVVAICQPRLPRDQQITIAQYDRADIEASRKQLYDIWDASKSPDAPLTASEEACRFCRAKPCEAYQATIDNALALVPTPPAGTVAAREAAVARSLKERTPEELALLDRGVKFAGFLRDPLHEEMRARIKAGTLPGYKLGKESEVREVTDVVVAIERLVAGGVKIESIKGALTMKIGEVEKACRSANPDMTWKEAKDQVNTTLNGLIARHPKKPSVERVTT